MKVKTKITMLALVVVCVAGITSFKRDIETAVYINASPAKIYDHMTDFEAYEKWSPFIKNISGNLKVNETLNVFIQPKGEEGMSFRPNVLTVDKNKEIRWLGKLGIKGVFDGEHYFRLEEVSKGRTKLIHGEHFSGIFVPILWGMIKNSTTNGFIAHNKALKILAEAD